MSDTACQDAGHVRYCPDCEPEAFVRAPTHTTRVHELKCPRSFYEPVVAGRKTFDLRKDDRRFAEGDLLVLREMEHGIYTGRECVCYVSYVVRGEPWLKAGFACLAIRVLQTRVNPNYPDPTEGGA